MTRIAFAGTPEFARDSLRSLVEAGLAPIVVLTQPDRPAGRGKKIAPGAVKNYAIAQSLPVMQPPSLRDDDVVSQLRAMDIDVFVVAAYGLLLPQKVFLPQLVVCMPLQAYYS